MQLRVPLLLLLLWPAWLWAQAPAPHGEKGAPAALSGQLDELLVREGKHTVEALQREGNYQGALTVLRLTYARVPTPFLLWPIAQLSARAGQPRAGLQALDEYLARIPEAERDASAEEVGRLRAELRALEVPPPRSLRPPPRRRPLTIAKWTLLGTGLAAAGVGTALLATADAKAAGQQSAGVAVLSLGAGVFGAALVVLFTDR